MKLLANENIPVRSSRFPEEKGYEKFHGDAPAGQRKMAVMRGDKLQVC